MPIAPPRDRPWTADDLEALPDNARYEVLDGTLFVSPLERNLNLDAGIALRRQIEPQLPAGWVAEREVGVRLGTDGLVPDLVVMRSSRAAPPHQLGVRSTELALVVEIVSPTSRKRDRFLKPAAYAEAGIPVFWRLELEPEVLLHAFMLVNGGYSKQAEPVVLGRPMVLDLTALKA